MADGATKIMQYLEICKRPPEMHMLQYHAECGATAACTLRLTKNQSDDEDWIVSAMMHLSNRTVSGAKLCTRSTSGLPSVAHVIQWHSFVI